MQSLKKNWLVVSNMTWGIWWIFTQPLKSLKNVFWWALFVQSIQGLSYKNTEALWRRTVMYKIWLNPDLAVPKNPDLGALKSLKSCTLMGSFCAKHIIFQVENFIRIMSWHWRAMQSLKYNWLVAWKMT